MKTALITGCNGGLGKVLLRQFASMGYNVVALSVAENDDFLCVKNWNFKIRSLLFIMYMTLQIEVR